jgi:hypothetical protein
VRSTKSEEQERRAKTQPAAKKQLNKKIFPSLTAGAFKVFNKYLLGTKYKNLSRIDYL